MWFAKLLESINNQAVRLFTLAYTQKLAIFPVIVAIVCINLLFGVGSTFVASVWKLYCSGIFGCLPAKKLPSFLRTQLPSWFHIFRQVCLMQYCWGLSQGKNSFDLSALLCTELLFCLWLKITFSWVFSGWFASRTYQAPWWLWCSPVFKSSRLWFGVSHLPNNWLYAL